MRCKSCLLLILSVLALITAPACAIDTSFTYQGKLTDTAGVNMPDGNYQLTFVLCTNADGTGAIWTSSPTTVAVKEGIFTTTVTPPSTAYTSHSNLWLETRVAGTALTPRPKVNTVPFAYRSATADTVPDGSLTYAKLSGAATRAPFLAGVTSGLPAGLTLDIAVGGTPLPTAVLAGPMTLEFELPKQAVDNRYLYFPGRLRAYPLFIRRPVTGNAFFRQLYAPGISGSPTRVDVVLTLRDVDRQPICTWTGTRAWASHCLVRIADDGLPVEELRLEFDGDRSPRREVVDAVKAAPVGSGVQVGFTSGQPSGTSFRVALDGVSQSTVVVASDSGGVLGVGEDFDPTTGVVRRILQTAPNTILTVRQSPGARYDLYAWWLSVLTSPDVPRKTIELRTVNGTSVTPIIRYLEAFPFSYSLKLGDDGLPFEEYKIAYNQVEPVL